MARIMDDLISEIHIQVHTPKQQQQQDPIKAEGPTVCTESTAKNLSSKIFLLLFFLHLILLPVLLAFLTIRGIISATQTHRRNLLLHWYAPLITSSLLAALTSFACQVALRRSPSRTLRSAFWLSPLLTCAAGILLLLITTPGALIAALFALLFAFIQSVYGCWVVPRLDHATRILSVSLSAPTPKATRFLTISLLLATAYSSFTISGLAGLIKKQTRFDPLFVAVILLSFTWTMQVIRNTFHVAVSRPAYTHFTRVNNVDMSVSFRRALGSICLGSILVPIFCVICGLARVMTLIAGGTDEFMFSCASCYASIADRLVVYGNRWGFVHVGVHGKGFIRASVDTWKMFDQGGMKLLIDSDLTGTICFLFGVAGGALCTVVAGSWTLAAHKEFATQVSIFAFLVGYFVVRTGMAWPQGCVSAYHVAFAENPQNPQFDSTISSRIQELEKSQA